MPVRKNPKDISKNNVKTSEKETIKISSKKTKEKDNAVNETNQVKKDGEKLFKKCPNCGKEIDKRAIKCQYCKKFLTKAKIECPFCFNEIDEDSKRCPLCDEFIKGPEGIEKIDTNYTSLFNINKDSGTDFEKENEKIIHEENSEKNVGGTKKYRCGYCKGDVDESDEECPHCGRVFDNDDADEVKLTIQTTLLVFFLIVVAGVLISYFN